MEQLADLAPMVQILDDPVPLMVGQLVEVFRFLDVLVPEQVIEVPKIPQDRIPKRSVDRRRPQKAGQLVELPTVLSPSLLRQQSAKQVVDIPAQDRIQHHRTSSRSLTFRLQGFRSLCR